MRPEPVLLAALLALPGTEVPRQLSGTGLYQKVAGLVVDPANRPYAPQYPLWSDGADKARWCFLPPGRTIDASRPEAWVFPVGTRFWKEFSFNGRRVETRMLWHSSRNTWTYAAYLWRPDQTDADLVAEAGGDSAAEIAPGRTHRIPSQQDCLACHGNGGPQVLGFTALQLSDDRDPLAPHAEPLRPGMATLATLERDGLVTPARRQWIDQPPRIQAERPRTRAALGYLSANCGNCHQAEQPIPGVALILRQPVGLASLIDLPTHGEVPGWAGRTRAIVPGAPEGSLILHRMGTRSPYTRMPPMASELVDTQAVELLRAWISQDLGP
jgi:mono/diheme cytochrome c family protein